MMLVRVFVEDHASEVIGKEDLEQKPSGSLDL
jgi:hypothetical protein